MNPADTRKVKRNRWSISDSKNESTKHYNSNYEIWDVESEISNGDSDPNVSAVISIHTLTIAVILPLYFKMYWKQYHFT